jgi:hypothetical protein
VPIGAVRGLRRKGEEDEGRETDERVPLVSEKEEKIKRCWLAGLRK